MSVVCIVQMSQLFLLVLTKEANFIIRWLDVQIIRSSMEFVACVPGNGSFGVHQGTVLGCISLANRSFVSQPWCVALVNGVV